MYSNPMIPSSCFVLSLSSLIPSISSLFPSLTEGNDWKWSEEMFGKWEKHLAFDWWPSTGDHITHNTTPWFSCFLSSTSPSSCSYFSLHFSHPTHSTYLFISPLIRVFNEISQLHLLFIRFNVGVQSRKGEKRTWTSGSFPSCFITCSVSNPNRLNISVSRETNNNENWALPATRSSFIRHLKLRDKMKETKIYSQNLNSYFTFLRKKSRNGSIN